MSVGCSWLQHAGRFTYPSLRAPLPGRRLGCWQYQPVCPDHGTFKGPPCFLWLKIKPGIWACPFSLPFSPTHPSLLPSMSPLNRKATSNNKTVPVETCVRVTSPRTSLPALWIISIENFRRKTLVRDTHTPFLHSVSSLTESSPPRMPASPGCLALNPSRREKGKQCLNQAVVRRAGRELLFYWFCTTVWRMIQHFGV